MAAKISWGYLDKDNTFTPVEGATCSADVERAVTKNVKDFIDKANKAGSGQTAMEEAVRGQTFRVVSVKAEFVVGLKVRYDVELGAVSSEDRIERTEEPAHE